MKEAALSCGMFYIDQRWLGGMLTNFKTIRTRVERLKKLEAMEQDGTFEVLPKKEVIVLKKEMAKLETNLGGIKDMEELPGVIFIVDSKKEAIAIQEAKKLNKNSICINNGIDIEKLDKETAGFKERKVDFDNLKICTVGRIDYSKNPEFFNRIAEEFSNIQFTWIGEGSLRNKLISPNITITGWKTREEVLQILNDHDVFVLCSLWEGLPISLLEAMYLEKICIVSDCIGNRDVIVDGENGFIANKLEDYQRIIKNILEENIDVSSVTRKTKEAVDAIYNTQSMIFKYKKVYDERNINDNL